MKIISVENLCKSYGDRSAVNKISFDVEEGSLFAFLGKNGAGKSTTINIISTLLKSTSGKVIVNGFELGKENEKIKNSIGIVFQESILDKNLTVYENLIIRGSMYKISKIELVKKIEELTKIFDLESILHQKYGSLSGGQKRIVDISKGLINSPKILILDEPTTGLDPEIRIKLWDILKKLREEKGLTIFLTTHYMEETKFADKVIIINKGEIIAEGTPSELKNKYSKSYLKLVLKDNNTEILKGYDYGINGDAIVIAFKTCFDVLDYVNKNKADILSFEIYNGDMDDVFLKVNEVENVCL